MDKEYEKQAYRIAEFCASYGISKSNAYKEIGRKRLATIKFGRMTLISKDAAQNWLNLCKSEAQVLKKPAETNNKNLP